MRKLILIIGLLMYSTSYGQHDWSKGELHLKDGSILHGYIKLPTVHSTNLIIFPKKEKIKFKTTHIEKAIKYGEPEVVRVVQISTQEVRTNFEYVSITKRKRTIMEVVQKGKVSLFARNVKLGGGGTNISGAGGATYWVGGGGPRWRGYVIRAY